ncbi:MAG: CocE/NonD family hydrolase, partial [Frankiaceae bacterium]|nr:CocE/NonD family hydrolase [Frankiaceae bacterium]
MKAPTNRRAIAIVAAVLIVGAGATILALRSGSERIATRSQFVAGTPEADGQPAPLDTTLYLPRRTPAPAILLAHGFGGSKADLDGPARALARSGYAVLAYTARGFGRSGGLIHLDAPDYEVADASALVSYLATLPEVTRDAPGDPRVGVAGSSYGGGLALLLAGYDQRVDAVAADITWNSLAQALFPNSAQPAAGASPAPGVFKRLWAAQLFASRSSGGAPDAGSGGGAGPAADGQCGRFAPVLCSAYQAAAQTGAPDPEILALLQASSPASVLDRITAPTLLTQGQQDSLFPLSEADANARGIAAHGTAVKLVWRSGGHDGGISDGELTGDWTRW